MAWLNHVTAALLRWIRPGTSEPAWLARLDPAAPRGLSSEEADILNLLSVAARLAGDAAKILAALSRPGAPSVGDRSSPDEIRALFGLSKKAFKRAIGHLLKTRAVTIEPDGTVRIAR